jgi:hypothetical protein
MDENENRELEWSPDVLRARLEAALPAEADGFREPPEEDVLAFLERRATSEQEDRVLKAMTESESFRAMVVDLAAAIGEPAEAASARREKAPRIAADHGKPTEGVLDRLRRVLWTPQFAYALCAGLALMLFVVEPRRPWAPSLPLALPGQLVALQGELPTRGSGAGSATVEPLPDGTVVVDVFLWDPTEHVDAGKTYSASVLDKQGRSLLPADGRADVTLGELERKPGYHVLLLADAVAGRDVIIQIHHPDSSDVSCVAQREIRFQEGPGSR